MKADSFIWPEISDSNWKYVFAYAAPEAAPPGSDVSTEAFTREDVAEIIAFEDGENDHKNWILVGQLWDQRFFSISAGCDYTGWG